jgi:hypothetical protein
MVTKAQGQRARSRNHKPAPHANLPPGAIVMDIKKYGGRWIATRRGKVMAVADSYKQLDLKVVDMGIENEVIFTQVPKSGALVY